MNFEPGTRDRNRSFSQQVTSSYALEKQLIGFMVGLRWYGQRTVSAWPSLLPSLSGWQFHVLKCSRCWFFQNKYFHNLFSCLGVSSVDWIHTIFGHQPQPINANPCLCAPRFCANVTHTQPDVFQQSSNVWAGFGKYDDKYHLVCLWWCSLPREQAEVWGSGGKELFAAGPLSPAVLVLSREHQNSACQGLLPIVCTPGRGSEPRLFLPCLFSSSFSVPISLSSCSSCFTSRCLFHHLYSAVLLLFFLSDSLKSSPHLINYISWVKCLKAVISR